ncbi:MAG: GNAT family protein [Saprospiraceae bacterium]
MNPNKISLRPLQESDRNDLILYANNKNIFDNLRDLMPFPYHKKDFESFYKLIQDEEPVKNFAIAYNHQFCGMIGLHLQQDVYRKTAEIGYWIGEPFWNKGIGTGAVGLIVRYGLDSFDINRIHAGVFEYNKASMRVLEKNGFELEGIARKAIFKNGKVWNEHRFALVADKEMMR